MKLYYSPGACSLAPHIVLCEMGIAYEKEKVDLAQKKTELGADYWAINAKGSVPAIKMDNGEVLTEASVILRYLADQKPEAKLAPKHGSMEHFRFLEWLNFTSTELHKGIGMLFGVGRLVKSDGAKEELNAGIRAMLEPKLKFLSSKFRTNDYVMGKEFSVADAYLFTVLNWTYFHKVDLSAYKNLQDFMERMKARPAVQRALKEEGLLK